MKNWHENLRTQKKREKDTTLSMSLAKRKKCASHGFFSYIPVSKITLGDIYCSTLLCILLVRKKSYSIENNPPMKKKSYRTGRRSESLQGLGGVMIYYFQKLVGVVVFAKVQGPKGTNISMFKLQIVGI